MKKIGIKIVRRIRPFRVVNGIKLKKVIKHSFVFSRVHNDLLPRNIGPHALPSIGRQFFEPGHSPCAGKVRGALSREDCNGKLLMRVPKSVHVALLQEADWEDISLNQLILPKLCVQLKALIYCEWRARSVCTAFHQVEQNQQLRARFIEG